MVNVSRFIVPIRAKNSPAYTSAQPLGRTKAKQGTQQYPQFESGNVDNVALLYILGSAQKAAPHTAPVKVKGKAALQFLAPCA